MSHGVSLRECLVRMSLDVDRIVSREMLKELADVLGRTGDELIWLVSRRLYDCAL